MTVGNIAAVTSGSYTITVQATGTTNKTVDVELIVSGGIPNFATLNAPINGATDIAMPVNLAWSNEANASEYRLQIATANTFGGANIINQDVNTNSRN